MCGVIPSPSLSFCLICEAYPRRNLIFPRSVNGCVKNSQRPSHARIHPLPGHGLDMGGASRGGKGETDEEGKFTNSQDLQNQCEADKSLYVSKLRSEIHKNTLLLSRSFQAQAMRLARCSFRERQTSTKYK